MKKHRTKKASGRFCVISNNTPGGGRRTVLSTEALAIDHAKALMNEDYNRGQFKKSTMYVVEIKKIIEPGDVPVKISLPAKLEVQV